MEAQYLTSSWYGDECEIIRGKQHCNTTRADGRPYDKMAMTVAHKTLPFGTKLLLYNPENGRQVVAVVRDRGPFIKGREIDCSEGIAIKLGFKRKGVTQLLAIRLNYIERIKKNHSTKILRQASVMSPRTASKANVQDDSGALHRSLYKSGWPMCDMSPTSGQAQIGGRPRSPLLPRSKELRQMYPRPSMQFLQQGSQLF